MNLSNVTSTLRVREYYYMLLRHKFLFTALVTISILTAGLVSLMLPKIYRAETILLIKEERILNPLISGLAISPRAAERMRTLREELLSWQRLTLLVEKLELDRSVKTPLDYEELIQNLRNNITVRLRGQDLIRISFEGSDPKKAQEIVQTLSDIIIDGNIMSQNIEANSAIRFIEGRLGEYRTKLEDSEETLREYKEVYNRTLPIATRMNEQLVQLKLQLSSLMVDNTEAHPKVLQTRKLIAQIEGQRDEFMRLAEEQGVLEISATDYAQLVSSVPRQEQHLSKLQRDYGINARIYDSLLSRLETAKISETLEQSDQGTKFQVLEPARLPLKPIKPNKPIILLAGLMIGIALGIIVLYLLELSDDSIRNEDQARMLLNLPVFGAIGIIRPEELIAGRRIRTGVHISV